MEAAINAGAEDVSGVAGEEGLWTVTTGPTDFFTVRTGLEKAGIPIEEARIAMIPTTRVEVRGENARNILGLIDEVEDLDDVQKVFANFDIPESEMAKLS